MLLRVKSVANTQDPLFPVVQKEAILIYARRKEHKRLGHPQTSINYLTS